MSDDGGIDGIDLGDLPDVLARVAKDAEDHDADADDALPIRPSDPPGSFCPHKTARIDGNHRRLTCRECGGQLDPFDFLLTLSRDSEKWIRARKDAEARAKTAADNLEVLLRDERNARARVNRLRRRLT